MDHGRKIGRTEAPRLSMKEPKLSFVTVTDCPFVKDDPIVEDRRLINWKRWLKIHQKQYRALNEGVGYRNERDMVMNSCEKIRPKTEMRNLTEPTTVRPVSGKYSADLAFWKLPPILSNHGNPCLPDISPVLTKKDLMLPPTFEHVDISKYIKTEKNLSCPEEKVSADRECLSSWKESASTRQPDVPDVADFVVIGGQRFGRGKQNTVHIPAISITDTSYETEAPEVESRRLILDPGVVVSLKINDFKVTVDEQSICKSSGSESEKIVCTLKFTTKVNQKSKKCIYFENQGTVAITYQWRKETHTSNILPLSSKHATSFFFNKNKALLLPGQKFEFPVWFHRSRPGIFSESWRMVIDPIVFRATIVINMRGYAASEYTDKAKLDIDAYLDRCIRNTAVRETIDEIIYNVRLSNVREPLYNSWYLERELFQAKNPSHFYHAGLVTQMYNLYKCAEVPTNAASWTLSLIDLRRILLQFKNPQLRHEMLTAFSDLCQQCLKPCLFKSIRNKKYTVVYNILCGLANRMEQESALVKLNCILTDQESLSSARNALSNLDAPIKESLTSISGRKGGIESSRSSDNSAQAISFNVKPLMNDCIKDSLYREVFYVRVYELLVEAVEQVTAAIDSLNNLNNRES